MCKKLSKYEENFFGKKKKCENEICELSQNRIKLFERLAASINAEA
jgi:hypothetical protein